MSFVPQADGRLEDAVVMRHAGRDLLSLALLQARNRTLAWLAVFDGLPAAAPLPGAEPAAWLAGHAGWFQERWIARHVQRSRGVAADPGGLRLASIEPHADAWFDPAATRRAERWAAPPPAPEVRAFLEATLDATLSLLERAGEDDAALHVFRLALAHEDRIGERLAALAAASELPDERRRMVAERGLWPERTGRPPRPPLAVPARRWRVAPPADGGWWPEAEQGRLDEPVPPFEIDAQPVDWAAYAEFIADGGYDDRRCWTEAGWAWRQQALAHDGGPRRAPRGIEQVAGGVVARVMGRLERWPGGAAVVHATVHEAEAWCRWAGRRLPTEAEWSVAVTTESGRGFAWGEVQEWVLGTARPLPGAPPQPPVLDRPGLGEGGPPRRVLRGASAHGSGRLRHPQARRYAGADEDLMFTGFRSCAA